MDLDTTPAMAAPAGESSDFNAPVTDAQWDFIRVSAGVIGGATLSLVFRIWARAGVVRQFGLDDCESGSALSRWTCC